jgi:hypothetical protein
MATVTEGGRTAAPTVSARAASGMTSRTDVSRQSLFIDAFLTEQAGRYSPAETLGSKPYAKVGCISNPLIKRVFPWGAFAVLEAWASSWPDSPTARQAVARLAMSLLRLSDHWQSQGRRSFLGKKNQKTFANLARFGGD